MDEGICRLRSRIIKVIYIRLWPEKRALPLCFEVSLLLLLASEAPKRYLV